MKKVNTSWLVRDPQTVINPKTYIFVQQNNVKIQK